MRKEQVTGHRRRLGRGKYKNKLIHISPFERKAKPKAKGNIVPFKDRYVVSYYRDSQGRIASKRVYKKY
jgi:hypothetical protein